MDAGAAAASGADSGSQGLAPGQAPPRRSAAVLRRRKAAAKRQRQQQPPQRRAPAAGREPRALADADSRDIAEKVASREGSLRAAARAGAGGAATRVVERRSSSERAGECASDTRSGTRVADGRASEAVDGARAAKRRRPSTGTSAAAAAAREAEGTDGSDARGSDALGGGGGGASSGSDDDDAGRGDDGGRGATGGADGGAYGPHFGARKRLSNINDEWQTTREAWASVLRVLPRAWRKRRIWMPFYYDGECARHLRSLGCSDVVHEREDFFARARSKAFLRRVDVILDNPPYTGPGMKERVLQALRDTKKPFCMLLPSSVLFSALVRDCLDMSRVQCVVPRRVRVCKTGKDAVPFKQLVWLCYDVALSKDLIFIE